MIEETYNCKQILGPSSGRGPSVAEAIAWRSSTVIIPTHSLEEEPRPVGKEGKMRPSEEGNHVDFRESASSMTKLVAPRPVHDSSMTNT